MLRKVTSSAWMVWCAWKLSKKHFISTLSPHSVCTSTGRQAIHQQANVVSVTEKSTPTAEWVPHTSISLMSTYDVRSPPACYSKPTVSHQADHVIWWKLFMLQSTLHLLAALSPMTYFYFYLFLKFLRCLMEIKPLWTYYDTQDFNCFFFPSLWNVSHFSQSEENLQGVAS